MHFHFPRLITLSKKVIPALIFALVIAPLSWGASQLFQVGFLFDSSINDAGWTCAHNAGRLYLESHLPNCQTIYAENIPENSNAERVLEKMVAQGCKLIFTTSYGFLEPAHKVAERHPQVTFMQINRFERDKNLGTYFCHEYEPMYIAGMIAGKMTKTNKLGLVGGHPIPVVLVMANSFEMGARSVNPKARLKVVWINSWSDPPSEAESVKGLKETGVDVVTQVMDSNQTVLSTAESLGMYSVGDYIDAHELAPKGWLTGGCLDWGPFYLDIAKSVLNHSWKPGILVRGMPEGTIKLSSIGAAVPAAVRQQALKLAEEIKHGRLVVFAGPLKDRDGKERLAAGKSPDIHWLSAMDFFVDGIDGVLPRK